MIILDFSKCSNFWIYFLPKEEKLVMEIFPINPTTPTDTRFVNKFYFYGKMLLETECFGTVIGPVFLLLVQIISVETIVTLREPRPESCRYPELVCTKKSPIKKIIGFSPPILWATGSHDRPIIPFLARALKMIRAM